MNKINNFYNQIYNEKSADFSTHKLNAINHLLAYYNIPNSKDAINTLFNKLSLIVDIYWDNYAIIARALNSLYPNEDLVNITNKDLLEKIINLPNFKDTKHPKDDDYYTAILNTWIIFSENSL